MTETGKRRESDLYRPVKRHLEARGFTVRGEVGACDMVGVDGGGLMIAVELKLGFGLPVLYQALRRLALVDLAYVAVAVPEGRRARGNWDAQAADAVRLCRMLGVGLLTVRDGVVMTLAEAEPYRPRKQPKRRARLLSEFARRSGDHNLGGTTRRPRVTAYREDALACAAALAANGPMKGSAVRDATGVAQAGVMLRADVYGWFERIERGIYALRPAGRLALDRYGDVVLARSAAPRALSGSVEAG